MCATACLLLSPPLFPLPPTPYPTRRPCLHRKESLPAATAREASKPRSRNGTTTAHRGVEDGGREGRGRGLDAGRPFGHPAMAVAPVAAHEAACHSPIPKAPLWEHGLGRSAGAAAGELALSFAGSPSHPSVGLAGAAASRHPTSEGACHRPGAMAVACRRPLYQEVRAARGCRAPEQKHAPRDSPLGLAHWSGMEGAQ